MLVHLISGAQDCSLSAKEPAVLIDMILQAMYSYSGLHSMACCDLALCGHIDSGLDSVRVLGLPERSDGFVLGQEVQASFAIEICVTEE